MTNPLQQAIAQRWPAATTCRVSHCALLADAEDANHNITSALRLQLDDGPYITHHEPGGELYDAWRAVVEPEIEATAAWLRRANA
jgi:hypothetical protein